MRQRLAARAGKSSQGVDTYAIAEVSERLASASGLLEVDQERRYASDEVRPRDQILEDLVAATAPKFMRLTAEFWVRGGIDTTVIAEHRADGWTAADPVQLP